MNSYNFTVNADGTTGERRDACRCGVVHAGVYAAEDSAQHECLHEGRLWDAGEAGDGRTVLCGDCGKLWIVETRRSLGVPG